MTLSITPVLFFACIAARLVLVLLAMTVSQLGLRIMAVGATGIAIGFMVIFLGGYRKTGLETGGKPIWWNHLRPVHALLYGLFAYLAWTGQRAWAWKVLLLDVTVGTLAFTLHHCGL
jgi:hypothetical protein